MLNYSKTILLKVGFDRNLFEKELSKALRTLPHEEAMALYEWCLEHFGNNYFHVIEKAFQKNRAFVKF
jgi:hypothetical protein